MSTLHAIPASLKPTLIATDYGVSEDAVRALLAAYPWSQWIASHADAWDGEIASVPAPRDDEAAAVLEAVVDAAGAIARRGDAKSDGWHLEPAEGEVTIRISWRDEDSADIYDTHDYYGGGVQ